MLEPPERGVQVVGHSATSSKPPNLEALPKARETLQKREADKMTRFNIDVLQELCNEHGISHSRKATKIDLAHKLVRDLTK